MLSTVVTIMFVLFSALLAGKILRHFFPDSGLDLSRRETGTTANETES